MALRRSTESVPATPRQIASSDKEVIVSDQALSARIQTLMEFEDLKSIKDGVETLASVIRFPLSDCEGLLSKRKDGNSITLNKEVLLKQLDQIAEAKTAERALYYLARLSKGLTQVRTSSTNDLNLNRWKEYDEIITDSLWVLDRRDSSGVHAAWYWGNFIPQIPRQLMLRYTKRNDLVVDAFVGSGTTLIECRRLGRNGIGFELLPQVAEVAEKHSSEEKNTHGIKTKVVVADSRNVDVSAALNAEGYKSIQLLIMHPPYHDIIQFSSDERDLSNAPSGESFLEEFGKVVDNFAPYLDRGRYFGLVIGDKYAKGEWVPLGFQCMNEVLKRGFSLKSIVVKNFDSTRGKRNQQELWRYRAIVGGFYVFKHEYVMIFRKR